MSNISKLYERCMHQQINEYFESLLSKFQCGFRQGFSAQHCLLVMVKKMKKIRDKKGVFAAVLTDLSKAFDCIRFLKLNAFGFDKKSLSFISAYLYNRKQKTKVGSEFSDFLNILFGVPQGLILGPIFLIIFITDLFFINNDIGFASYADDTTPYACEQNFSEVINFLESNVTKVFKWFHENGLMVNSSKSNFLISPYETKSIQINYSCIKATSSEKLLGIKIDSNLTFHDLIISFCWKANKKLSTLSGVLKYMGINKRRILMKSYILSQFNYCLLAWMCHTRKENWELCIESKVKILQTISPKIWGLIPENIKSSESVDIFKKSN